MNEDERQNVKRTGRRVISFCLPACLSHVERREVAFYSRFGLASDPDTSFLLNISFCASDVPSSAIFGVAACVVPYPWPVSLVKRETML